MLDALFKLQMDLRRNLRHRLVLPKPGDQYLAAFPRSGSTWLRTILTNVLVPGADSDPDVFNRRIPGVSLRRIGWLNRLPPPRLMMTHSEWRPNFPRVVCLVRDGRDAVVSLYHYMTTRKGKDRDFGEFLDRYLAHRYGPTWDENVRSWLVEGRRAMGDDLKVIYFEDLKADPPRVASAVLDFLGHPTERSRVEAASAAASIDRLRSIERKRRGHELGRNERFYRGGKTGQWEEVITGEDLKRFMSRTAEVLELAGYEV